MIFTITIVHRLVREDRERSSSIISPPPSTVSIVLARRFGVKASKSYNHTQKENQNKNEATDQAQNQS